MNYELTHRAAVLPQRILPVSPAAEWKAAPLARLSMPRMTLGSPLMGATRLLCSKKKGKPLMPPARGDHLRSQLGLAVSGSSASKRGNS
jgi:hypothetical protein